MYVKSHTNNYNDLSKLTYTKHVATLKTSKTVLEKLLGGKGGKNEGKII